jgi:hypothetical protein
MLQIVVSCLQLYLMTMDKARTHLYYWCHLWWLSYDNCKILIVRANVFTQDKELFPPKFKFKIGLKWKKRRFLIETYRKLSTMERLLNGKAEYDRPPWSQVFRSAAFMFTIYIFLFYKTSYFNKEVNSSEPSPSVRVPCSIHLLRHI